MSDGKAHNILRKLIMFSLVQELGKDICFRCGKKIETIDEFSIDHKVAWLNSENPVSLYFDLENISFSHCSCNIAAKRVVPRKPIYTKEELRQKKSVYEKKRRSTEEYKEKNKEYMRSRYADPKFWERHKEDSRKSYRRKKNAAVAQSG